MTNFLVKIAKGIQRLLNEETKALCEAGLRKDDLTLSKAGRFAVLEILAEQPEIKAALVAKAQEVIAERKAEEERARG